MDICGILKLLRGYEDLDQIRKIDKGSVGVLHRYAYVMQCVGVYYMSVWMYHVWRCAYVWMCMSCLHVCVSCLSVFVVLGVGGRGVSCLSMWCLDACVSCLGVFGVWMCVVSGWVLCLDVYVVWICTSSLSVSYIWEFVKSGCLCLVCVFASVQVVS